MTTTYEQIRAFHEAGDAPEVIVAKLRPLTRNVIQLSDLTYTLNRRKMLTRLPRTDPETGVKWKGTVYTMMDAILSSDQTTVEQKEGIEEWFSHITNERMTTFNTRDLAFATTLQSLKDAFAGLPGMPSAEDFDAIFELGGGQPHADLTVETVKELIAERERQERRKATVNACLKHYQDALGVAKAHLNDAQASLGPEHIDSLSEEELQAYCDSIVANGNGLIE